MHALVAEAMKKAAIIWITTADDQPPFPLWCLPSDGALFVVTGGDEQPAPGLAEADTATIIARGDHGGRIVAWPVSVSRVTPDGDAWATIATALAGKRLNAALAVNALADVWASNCAIIRLTPVADDIAPRPTGSGAAVPAPTSAARRAGTPLRTHGG
jgi:hypothetical protein